MLNKTDHFLSVSSTSTSCCIFMLSYLCEVTTAYPLQRWGLTGFQSEIHTLKTHTAILIINWDFRYCVQNGQIHIRTFRPLNLVKILICKKSVEAQSIHDIWPISGSPVGSTVCPGSTECIQKCIYPISSLPFIQVCVSQSQWGFEQISHIFCYGCFPI